MTDKTLAISLKPTITISRITLVGMLLMGAGLLLLGAALLSWLTAQTASVGDTIQMHYTLRLEDQSVYYETEKNEPAEYTLGENQLLPALEAVLVGMRVGDKKSISLAPEQAYGPVRPELILTLQRSELPEGSQPVVGQQILTESEGGSPLVMVVTEVTEDTVTLDANHPLAGHVLSFEIELMAVKQNGQAAPAPNNYNY